MRKQLPAFIAAFLITGCLGLGMFFVGAKALLNKNTVAAASAPDTKQNETTQVASAALMQPDQTQIQQMQNLLDQYQQREQQYQQRERQYKDQLSAAQQEIQQASAQIQQYQQLVDYLQRNGILHIERNGEVSVSPDD